MIKKERGFSVSLTEEECKGFNTEEMFNELMKKLYRKMIQEIDAALIQQEKQFNGN